MRLLLIIFDGLGDRPAVELDRQTPLEAARTPNLDRLAAEGVNGLQHAKSPGYPLGSPIAMHLLLGYAEEQFPDRGPLIARARGLEINEGDVLMSARFASADVEPGGLRLLERFINGREEDCAALAREIESIEIGGFQFHYDYSGKGDGILTIAGGASHRVTDSDPLALDLPVLRPRARVEHDDAPLDDVARRTADALSAYLQEVHARLSKHALNAPGNDPEHAPINCLITKWAGPRPALEPFAERWGMRAASLPDEEVVDGLMQELGCTVVHLSEPDPEQDLRRRLEAATELLDDGYEFVHLHTKYPDPSSHQNDPERCVEEIEALDRAMASYWDGLGDDPDLVTVLTTDHTTPSVWAGRPRRRFFDQHGGEESPLVIRGGNVRVDQVTAFGERAAAQGGLGHLRGTDFMPVLLNAAERTNMYEMRPTPRRRLYMPDESGLEALPPPQSD